MSMKSAFFEQVYFITLNLHYLCAKREDRLRLGKQRSPRPKG